MRGTAWAAGAAVIALLVFSSSANAAPQFLGRTPEDGKPGAGAGRLDFPLGVAASPKLPGHLYVASRIGNRIDEFTAWGQFVKGFGWDVDAGAPEEKLQVCTVASGCQEGTVGPGPGQFSVLEGVVVDPAGNVYVIETGNHRVQKFDGEGHFLFTFGDGVNKTAIEEARSGEEDVCPAPGQPLDVCQAGTPGPGPGQFGAGIAGYQGQLAVSPTDGNVFVGEGERVQVFKADGSFEEEIAMPVGKSVRSVAFDAAGDLYAAFGTEIRRLKASGPTAEFLTPTFTAETPASALTLDSAGNLYAIVAASGLEPERVLEFGSDGKCLTCGTEGEGGKPGFDRPTDGSALRGIGIGSACESADVYVAHFGNGGGGELTSYLSLFGPPPNPALCPQPKAAPSITEQFANSVGSESAEVRAKINPRFWPDTTYYVEYGTSPCSEGGCKAEPLPPGTALSSQVTQADLPAIALITGLAPATTYHFRFVAQSEGGGPVRGVGGEVGKDGTEAIFTTFAPTLAPKVCPNQAFRIGSAANLPDCRAYEMVSPVDKNNGDILAPSELSFTATGSAIARDDQSTPQGEALTYSSITAFGDAQSALFSSQYLAQRGEGAWSTHSLNPPLKGPSLYAGGGPFIEASFKGASEDLCSSWVLQNTDLALAPGAPAGVPNLYRRHNCGEESYETLTNVPPPGFSLESEGSNSSYNPTIQGFSADGSASAFKAAAPLTPEASTFTTGIKFLCQPESHPGEAITYQWLRAGIPIAKATEPDYTSTAADEGKAIQCQIAAVNEEADKASGGFAGSTQVSNSAPIIAPYPDTAPPSPPGAIAAPTTDAPLTVGGGGGQTLTCNPKEAAWAGSPSFAYQWYRNGMPIPGANAQTYPVLAGDLTGVAVFQCAVSATNAAGSIVAVSANLASGPEPDPPVPTATSRIDDVFRAYLEREGALHLISVLPDGNPAQTHASIGTAQGSFAKRLFDSVAGAVSDDGGRVFWSASIEEPPLPVHMKLGIGNEPSRLYLRLNARQPQSALTQATGTGALAAGSKEVKSLETTAGQFLAGQPISGPGIKPGTVIESVSGPTLFLSQPATEKKGKGKLNAIAGCSEEEKACTLQLTANAGLYRAANPSASRALFSEAGDLYLLDVDKAAKEGNPTAAKTLIAHKTEGILGTSEDLSKIYLVSEEVCSGEKLNGEEEKAEAGQPNLYLYEAGEECGAGEMGFVGRLANTSSDQNTYSSEPVNRSARVSADGMHVAFMSQARLTGYDNTDANSGQADAEVFLYSAKEGELLCVSCNPGGARPTGRARSGGVGAWAAAQIPGWETEWHASRLLSADGSRLFFESFEALVPRDTNGKQDVYEWERAASAKQCEEAGAETFVPQSDGCISLISSGKSLEDAEFLDGSTTGRDVFFITASSLLPQDPGLIDVYDAREGGGLPAPPTAPNPGCEGEACQSPPSATEDPPLASSATEGQGNAVTTKKHKPKKHKAKKKHAKHKKKRHQRGAGK